MGEIYLRLIGARIRGQLQYRLSFALYTIGQFLASFLDLVAILVLFHNVRALGGWTVDTQEVANSFTYGGGFASQYPLDIMAGWLKRTLLVVPLAFVAYLPAAWVLDKQNAYGFPTWVLLSSPLAALATALVARLVWRAAIREYRSTGS